METLKNWIKQQEIQDIKKETIEKLYAIDLNRDPARAIYVDPFAFYSPADGVILYSKIVSPKQNIVEIKGENYSVNSLLREELEEQCLVIGIFMTVLDVHINRIPTDGFLTYEKLPSLKSLNMSMRQTEKNILGQLNINYNNLKYALFNERSKNRIFYNLIDQYYYIVQIADFELDVIAHFDEKQNKYYSQGERFALVRMGSQVDLIIPFINKKIKFESLINNKILYHVEGGIDKIVKIK